MSDTVISVAELNRYVSHSLRMDPVLRDIRLRGEISGLKVYPSCWYFDLKDADAKVSCVMWNESVRRLSFQPRSGDQVILHGSASLYEKNGSFQFTADAMRPEGIGSLWQRYEELKARLRDEGLFDESRKKPLPVRPRRIAAVTSAEGAVWHDIRKVCAMRDPGVALVLVPVHVQGTGAAEEIAEGLRRAACLPEVDVIIVGRGGGSMEDLWCFNEEVVARAIADCPLPVISAVGHETDFTIADFCADRRAATPSNAAELAVPDIEDVLEALRMMRGRMTQAAVARLQRSRLMLAECRQRLSTCSPEQSLHRQRLTLEQLRTRLRHAAGEALEMRKERLRMLPLRMDRAAERTLQRLTMTLNRQRVRLEALNPMTVLQRGYVLALDGDRPVTSAAEAPERMRLRFRDGEIAVRREEEQHE
ncbi:MAG: exodeoxyribonuclease VII large subunit [Clostridia bacterium]|nr:exodeoxyribonuclease VII large subunit [Clostridia bacterium]